MRTPQAPNERRHDLDALRAAAMLLGIAYHVALSFALGFPWTVQEVSQSKVAYIFQAFVHGFRMQLFMLVSGFFTAMLWRQKGLKALIWHRFRRVPLLICSGYFMRKLIATGLLCLATLATSLAEDGKYHDKDVVLDEAMVPPYDLPPVLVTSEGRLVTTAEDWFRIRRPQIMALFGNLIYGIVPSPEAPIETRFEVLKTDPAFMGGKATRKDVKIKFMNAKGSADMTILVFTPNGAAKPAPAILQLSFANTKDDGHDAHPEKPGFLRNGIPLGDILQRGFGYVVVSQGALVRHNEVEFQSGIHPLFYRNNQSFPKANEWGCISAIAWSASRAMDYLETDHDIDAKRVAIMGHSKMGKTTLWTAAQDQRFALAISAQSGCAGAALWKRNYGENMEKMVTRFPYWLCRNAWKFVRNEDDLPVDQHMLLACIAPRPVYVHSGVDDTWADPRGEYLGAYYASEVYRLLGKKGLTSETSPPVGEAIIQSDVGYHNRPGGHSIEMFDWQKFLEFSEYHLVKK